MKSLIALFPKETMTIVNLASQLYKDSLGEDCPEYTVSLGGEGGNLDYVVVRGNPQSIMSIIGLVADHGDDSLLSVVSTEAGE